MNHTCRHAYCSTCSAHLLVKFEILRGSPPIPEECDDAAVQQIFIEMHDQYRLLPDDVIAEFQEPGVHSLSNWAARHLLQYWIYFTAKYANTPNIYHVHARIYYRIDRIINCLKVNTGEMVGYY